MTDPHAQPGAGWAPPSQPAGSPGGQPGDVQKPTLPPLSPPVPTAAPAGWAGSDPTVPMMQVASGSDGEAPPRRSRAKLVGALVGVTALVAAGAFAVVTITGNDDDGGAASPTEVGNQLTTALDNEDVLGVIDLLLPGERETFREPIIETFDNLRRLEILADEASLSDIGGIDIQLTDVTVRERPTNADDIVNIELSGSATVAVDGETVPLGSLIIDEAFDGERPDMDAEATTEEFEDIPLTVVQRDGRWYLSAFYSAAEQVRARTDLDVPETGVVAKGADAPEAAIDDMLEAISDQDLERVIALLDPTEAEALQRYAPLFLDDAQSEVDDLGVNWSVSDTAYTVEGSGSRRFVGVDAFTVTASEGDTNVSVTYADGCLSVDFDGDETEVCTADIGTNIDPLLEDAGIDDGGEIKDLIDTVQDALEDFDPSGIAVHEVDGQWYLSPLRSYFTLSNDFYNALDSGELRDIIAAARAMTDAPIDYMDDLDLPDIGDDPTEALPLDTLPDDDTSDTIPFDTTPGDTSVDEDFEALSACYAESDAAAGVQCMRDGVAAGTIDPLYVSPAILHPECGVAEVYWVSPFDLSDAEFVAMAEGASQCFLDLVAAGEVESYLLPSELVAPECLEGKNWYSTNDSAYDDRFFECVSQKRVDLGI
jgi:hypothetical protein